jgi:hypothetical protein
MKNLNNLQLIFIIRRFESETLTIFFVAISPTPKGLYLLGPPENKNSYIVFMFVIIRMQLLLNKYLSLA